MEELLEPIGLFAKYLPLHFQLRADQPFAEVLNEAERLIREAADHQEYYDWRLPAAFERAGVRFLPYVFDYQALPGRVWRLLIHRGAPCSDRLRRPSRLPVGGERSSPYTRLRSRAVRTPIRIQRLQAQFVALIDENRLAAGADGRPNRYWRRRAAATAERILRRSDGNHAYQLPTHSRPPAEFALSDGRHLRRSTAQLRGAGEPRPRAGATAVASRRRSRRAGPARLVSDPPTRLSVCAPFSTRAAPMCPSIRRRRRRASSAFSTTWPRPRS